MMMTKTVAGLATGCICSLCAPDRTQSINVSLYLLTENRKFVTTNSFMSPPVHWILLKWFGSILGVSGCKYFMWFNSGNVFLA